MSTKQEIKCPHCNKSIPIQESIKHQAEELRKKLETEEKQKSAIRQKEIAIIITRFNDKQYEIYEPIENLHEDQILKHSKIPAEISDKILDQSKLWATQIAEELKYVGTLCVEFFIDRNENLYVNEIAPRVHNSGHLTINTYNVSQFENHVRAVCQLEQIPLKKISNGRMINIIGDQISVYRNKKLEKNEFFYDYLKKEIKSKRKMGHLTTLIS